MARVRNASLQSAKIMAWLTCFLVEAALCACRRPVEPGDALRFDSRSRQSAGEIGILVTDFFFFFFFCWRGPLTHASPFGTGADFLPFKWMRYSVAILVPFCFHTAVVVDARVLFFFFFFFLDP